MPDILKREISFATLVSPIGRIGLYASGDWLSRIEIGAGESSRLDENHVLRAALDQLEAWLKGRLCEFDLPLEPSKTPRGEDHRAAIRAIGYGDTKSYGDLARQIQSSPRAIGQACRRNPFPIVVPCHRVTGASGAIGHYSAGDGLKTKLWLLQHEARRA